MEFDVDGITYYRMGSNEVALQKCEISRENLTLPISVCHKGVRYFITIVFSKSFSAAKIKNLVFPADSKIFWIHRSAFSGGKIDNIHLSRSIKFLTLASSNETSITVDKRNKFFSSDDNLSLYSNFPPTLINFRNISKVIIRESIVKVQSSIAYNNDKITSVFFPSSLKIIGDSAFEYCSNLSKIKFAKDSQLEIIENQAFLLCMLSGKIVFPPKLKLIGKYAFMMNSKLKEAVFQKSKEQIKFCLRAFDSNVKLSFGFLMKK